MKSISFLLLLFTINSSANANTSNTTIEFNLNPESFLENYSAVAVPKAAILDIKNILTSEGCKEITTTSDKTSITGTASCVNPMDLYGEFVVEYGFIGTRTTIVNTFFIKDKTKKSHKNYIFINGELIKSIDLK